MKVSIAEILLIILNANYNISELIVSVHKYSKYCRSKHKNVLGGEGR